MLKGKFTMGKALGFFEISGVVAAVNALDIMCKTSDVEFVTWEKKLGGRLVTLVVTGNISAVKSALETGKEKASALGTVYGCEAIPNLHGEVAKFFDFDIK